MPRFGSACEDRVWRVPKPTSFSTTARSRSWLTSSAASRGVTAEAEAARPIRARVKAIFFIGRLCADAARVARCAAGFDLAQLLYTPNTLCQNRAKRIRGPKMLELNDVSHVYGNG